MNVLLAGGYDTANYGDHAMLATLVRDLRRRDADATVTLLSRHPDPAFDRAFGVRSLRNLDHESREAARGRWFNGLNPGDDTAHLRRIREAMAAADALVIGGGRLLLDLSLGFLRGPLSYYAWLVQLARLFEKPVFVYGMTLVPLSSEPGREMARFVLGHAAAVAVREEPSATLARSLGVDRARLHVLPDPAFGLFDAVDAGAGAALLRGAGVPLGEGDRPLVALTARHIYWQQDRATFDAFAGELAALADAIADTYDAELVFLPHCTYTRHEPLVDDRRVAAVVREQMRRPERAHVVTAAPSLAGLLGAYRHVALLVGQRRHSIVFAALSGVPAVAVSDGPNVATMMERVGADARVLPLASFTAAAAKPLVEAAWQARSIERGRLLERCRQLGEETKGYVALLDDVVVTRDDGAGTAPRRARRPSDL